MHKSKNLIRSHILVNIKAQPHIVLRVELLRVLAHVDWANMRRRGQVENLLPVCRKAKVVLLLGAGRRFALGQLADKNMEMNRPVFPGFFAVKNGMRGCVGAVDALAKLEALHVLFAKAFDRDPLPGLVHRPVEG